MGASLGTGVAIALAATHEAAALVLEAPYLSALDVASGHYAIFPVSWLMLDQFRSDFAIHDVHVPVLMVHGEEDDVIPLNSARRLFELANAPKTFVSVPGGNHLVLGLAERLTLAFLVAAQHQRIRWRVKIEPDHVPELLLEIRVGRQLERPGDMRLQVVLRPDALHRAV